jgi:hypothetical protein
MKISEYYKKQGERVEFARQDTQYERIYASAIYTKSRPVCEVLLEKYGSRIVIGGTGWDIEKRLPPEIEACDADYSLYSADMVAARIKGIMSAGARRRKASQIVDAGMGFSSRGCNRNCDFCVVPQKEGRLRQDREIRDLINPKSNVLVLHDNNFTADPYCLDKINEIKQRGLVVDINQGCDVRLITDEIAAALASIKHLRSLHYAWDLMEHENLVLAGIKKLLKYVRPYRHMCFMLVGFNTDFEQDFYRFRRLDELKIDPYVMIYNQEGDERLRHFARWVNARIYTQCRFEEYIPWVKTQQGKLVTAYQT